MKLLLDENLSPRTARILRFEDGVDAVHVQERALSGASDARVWECAWKEERVVVTSNAADFTRLARGAEIHPGVVLILEGDLLASEQTEVVRDAVRLLESEAAEGRDLINRVLAISVDGSHRFENLPPSSQ